MVDIDYKRNARYFKAVNLNAVLCVSALAVVIMAVVALLGYLAFKNNMISNIGFGVGGAMLLFTGVYVLTVLFRRPSDEAIDADYQALADSAAQCALNKVGLAGEMQLEIQPVILSACIFEDIETNFQMAKGHDKKVRSSNFANFVLLFTLDQIVTYRSRNSIIRKESEETVEEYYYDDIVTFSNCTTITTPMQSEVRREVLAITTSAGTVLELPFEDNAAAEVAIMQIRKILRAKKRFK